MSKAPPNIPDVGSACEFRGRSGRVGKVVSYNPKTLWTQVEWEDGNGPGLCHLYELTNPRSILTPKQLG